MSEGINEVGSRWKWIGGNGFFRNGDVLTVDEEGRVCRNDGTVGWREPCDMSKNGCYERIPEPSKQEDPCPVGSRWVGRRSGETATVIRAVDTDGPTQKCLRRDSNGELFGVSHRAAFLKHWARLPDAPPSIPDPDLCGKDHGPHISAAGPDADRLVQCHRDTADRLTAVILERDRLQAAHAELVEALRETVRLVADINRGLSQQEREAFDRARSLLARLERA